MGGYGDGPARATIQSGLSQALGAAVVAGEAVAEVTLSQAFAAGVVASEAVAELAHGLFASCLVRDG